MGRVHEISFNDHLTGLKEKFELLTKEIGSLRKERDKYKAEVAVQTTELKNIRLNNVCPLCRKDLLGAHTATHSQIEAQDIIGKSLPSRPIASPPRHLSKQQVPKSPIQDLGAGPSVFTSRLPLYRPIGAQPGPPVPRNNTRTPVTAKLASPELSSPDDRNVFPPSQTVSPRPSTESILTPLALTRVSSQPVCHFTPPFSSDVIQSSRSTSSSYSLSSMAPSASIAGCDRTDLDWSVEFTHNVRKELNVTVAHTLPHLRAVYCVKFSANGRYLAVASRAKVFIYDVTTGSLTCTLLDLFVEDTWIRAMSFSPNGRYLTTGSEDYLIRVWETDKKRVRNVFKSHSKKVRCLEFSPDGRFLLSAALDNTVRIWNMRGGSVKVFTSPESGRQFKTAAFSPDGKCVAAGNADGIVRIWDVRTGQLVKRLSGHARLGIVYSIGFMPDGKGIVSGSKDNIVRYWNIEQVSSSHTKEQVRDRTNYLAQRYGEKEEQGKPLREFSGHTGPIYSVAVSHNGRWVVSGARDQSVCIWDVRNAEKYCVLQGHKDPIFSVEFSPAGYHFASSDADGMVRIWRYVEE